AGAVAGRQAPAVSIVADEFVRVELGVSALHENRAPAILEVVRLLLLHEGIADPAQVDPGLREVMDEQRAGVEKVLAIQVFPLVGGGPGGIAVGGDRMGRRAQRQGIQQQRLAVTLPAVMQIAAFGFPALPDGALAVLRPAPVDPSVQLVGQLAQFGLGRRVGGEIGGRGEHAGDQHGAVDHRQLRLPHPRAGADIEKVVVEALVAGRGRAAALVAVAKEMQHQQAAPHRLGTLHPAALDRRGIGRQRKADHRDAHRRVVAGGVGDESVGGVHGVHEVAEGTTLQAIEEVVVGEGAELGHRVRPDVGRRRMIRLTVTGNGSAEPHEAQHAGAGHPTPAGACMAAHARGVGDSHLVDSCLRFTAPGSPRSVPRRVHATGAEADFTRHYPGVAVGLADIPATPERRVPAGVGSPMSFQPSSSRPSAAAMQLLSNGRYTVMLSGNGTGFDRWHGLAVTRWREDPVVDPWGNFLLLRDETSGAVWSPTAQPFGVARPDDAVDFSPGRAHFSGRHHSLHHALEVAVAPTGDLALRRLTLSNHGDRRRTLSLTSYAELVLGPVGDDDGHPAFSKMFVQTEWDAAHGLLLATRRRRSDSQAQVWSAQALQVEGHAITDATHETDRARFLGRGRTLRNAVAMQPGIALSNTTGCVLDPVFSLRHGFTLAPGASIQLLLWTQLAESRDGAIALGDQLQQAGAAERLFNEATRHAQDELARFGIAPDQAARFAHWMGALLISDSSQRATPAWRERGRGGAPTLWGAGISGDRPIALLCPRDDAGLDDLDQLLLAQRWWRARQL